MATKKTPTKKPSAAQTSTVATDAPELARIKPALEPRLKDSDKTVANQAAVVWKRLGL